VKVFFTEYKRRSIIPICGLALLAYFLFVFLPLSRRAADLDPPLEKAWRSLCGSLERSNATMVNFTQITNQLAETRQALGLMDEAMKRTAERLRLGTNTQAKMEASFELYDYQNQRSKEADELVKLAKNEKVTIEPLVLAGFPEHTVDIKDPTLLWPALSMVSSLLTSAIKCQITNLHSLDVPLTLTNAAASNRLSEILIQAEFTGPFTGVLRLIQSLPLRSEELKSAGLPEVGPEKTPLFVDRLVIRKQTPEKPNEVRVALRLIGFVLRE
jgi:hypothetical protein